MTKRNNNDAIWTWLLLLASLLVLFWSTNLALQSKFFAGELSLLTFVYENISQFSKTLLFVTNVGTAVLFMVMLIILEINNRKTLLLRVSLAGAITSALVLFFKNIVNRARPEAILDIQSKELFTVGSQGFPSGHTALSAAIVLSVLPFIPKKYWFVVILIPFAVGLSRLGLGVHLPLDVLGGAVMGIMVAVGVRLSTTSEVFTRNHKRIASRIKKV